MSPRAWRERIRDILDALAEITAFTQGRTDASSLLLDICCYLLLAPRATRDTRARRQTQALRGATPRPRAPYACNGSHASYPHERKRPLGNMAGVAPRDAEACARYHLGLCTGGECDERWKVLQIVELLSHQEEHRAGCPCEAGGEIVHA